MNPVLERCYVDGPGGALEAVFEEPDTEAAAYYAVVCHPHPLFGGTMDNKVVTTLVRAMLERGIPSARFNFRGVGGSAGAFDAGTGETDDAQAVALAGAARWPGRRLILAGFSFGAYVAWRLALRLPAAQLITVAPPVGRFEFSSAVPPCPWLVVQGDADEVVDAGAVIQWVEDLEPAPQLIVMPGVGHFFHGRLLELRDAVQSGVCTSGAADLGSRWPAQPPQS